MARATGSRAPCEGNLCLARSWPGQMRTVFGDHKRFVETYFSTFPGLYFTGDGARRDEDGFYWITGRVDDVINVAGHRLGTAEIESALVAHPKVAEAAVVGYPHDIKGQGIYAYVTLRADQEPSEELRRELVQLGAQRDQPDRRARPACNGRRTCRRPAPARSCAASSGKSRRTSPASWATSRPWPTRASSTIWSTTA